MNQTGAWVSVVVGCAVVLCLPDACKAVEPGATPAVAEPSPPEDAAAAARGDDGDMVEGSAEGFVEPGPGFPHQHPHGAWYLGVYGQYTPTGLVLTEVHPGTAASRAGLEIGDRIVAVNGRQIGWVGRARLNLDAALQQTRSGWVRLLVHDIRTKELINLDVRLTRGRVHT